MAVEAIKILRYWLRVVGYDGSTHPKSHLKSDV